MIKPDDFEVEFLPRGVLKHCVYGEHNFKALVYLGSEPNWPGIAVCTLCAKIESGWCSKPQGGSDD